jgi:hypothetical protein
MATLTPTDDGLIDRALTAVFGRSYRTTLAGWAGLACAVVQLLPFVPHPVQDAAKALGPLILGSGLIVAKDNRVSGLPK